MPCLLARSAALGTLFAVTAATAAAAPIPRDATPDPVYAATRVGAKRVMGSGGQVMKTYTLTAAEPQPDGSVRIYEQAEFRGMPHPFQEIYSVSPKGVFLTGIARNEEGKDIRQVRVTPKWEPECLVRPPGKGGAKWEWSLIDPVRFRQMLNQPLPGYKVEGNVLVAPSGSKLGLRIHVYEVVGVEQVVVPAGTFQAVRVDQSVRDEVRPSDIRWTAWYAPGIGVVQTAINGRTLEQLQSFEPGPAPAGAISSAPPVRAEPQANDPKGVPPPAVRGGITGTFERNPETKRIDASFREGIHPDHAAVLREVPNLGHVSLVGFKDSKVRPTDDSLRVLRDVPCTGIAVAGPITDDGLATLAGRKDLEYLHLLGCPAVTPKGLAVVRQLPALTVFRADGVPVTDEGLAVVARHPGLTKVTLGDCPTVTDEGLAGLARHPGINYVGLHKCAAVTDAGLLALATPGRLRTLTLTSMPRLTGAGLAAACERTPELESLYFNRIPLTWQEAAVIIRLPKLKSLILGSPTEAAGQGEGYNRLGAWWSQRQRQAAGR